MYSLKELVVFVELLWLSGTVTRLITTSAVQVRWWHLCPMARHRSVANSIVSENWQCCDHFLQGLEGLLLALVQ